jgi:curved DNA-binding protein CbpA
VTNPPTTDPFTLLELPVRPFLEPTAVRDAFQRLGSECHPDVSTPDAVRFAALNDAARTLVDPAERLRVLATMRRGKPAPKKTAAVPQMLLPLFESTAPLVRDLDFFLRRRSTLKSAIARAGLAEQQMDLQERCMTALNQLAGVEEMLQAELRKADARWPEISPEELEALADAFKFAHRWRDKIQERLNRLAFE